MANFTPVVKAATSVLIHTPGLTRYGSKPEREIAANRARLAELNEKLRSFREAQEYLPNQVSSGNSRRNDYWKSLVLGLVTRPRSLKNGNPSAASSMKNRFLHWLLLPTHSSTFFCLADSGRRSRRCCNSPPFTAEL